MTTTLQAVREQLAIAVETTGLRCDAYPTDNVNAPCAQIDRAPMTPDMVFSEATQVARLVIFVFVPRTAVTQGYKLLDEFMDRTGAASIKAAIEDSDNWPTALGVHYCKLISWGQPQLGEDVAGATYIAARIEVEVVW